MSKLLPLNPSIEHLHKQAKDLLAQCKAGNADALKRVRQALTVFRFRSGGEIADSLRLGHASEVIAREHGFACWSDLSEYVQVERSSYRAMSEAVADMRMEDLTFRSGVARSKGLPEIGTSRLSEHGVRYDVTDYAPAISPQGAKRIRDGGALIQVEDLLPVIAFPEMSDRLYELYLETDCVTARPVVFLDTVPDRFPKHGLPGFHQVVAPAPAGPLFFLFDAGRVHETIIAHELGHVWVEMVERIEDYRHPKDQSDLARTTQLYHIQSFVMDLRVNDMLERRGFDMSIIARHQIEAIHTMAANCARGEEPGNKRILAGVISSLAGSLLEMERFPSKYGESIGTSLELIQRHLPEVFGPAKEFVRSVLHRGYDDCDAVRRVVNECSIISFAATGDSFDSESDLIDVPHEEPTWDKHPEFMPILPRSNKREVFRQAALYGVTGTAKYDLVISGRDHASVTLTAPELPEPVRFGFRVDLPPQPNRMLGALLPQIPVGSAYVPPPGMPYNGNCHNLEPAGIDPYRGLPENVREKLRAEDARLQQRQSPSAFNATNRHGHAPKPDPFGLPTGFGGSAAGNPWQDQIPGGPAHYAAAPDPFAEQKETVRRQNEEHFRQMAEEQARRRTEQMIMLERQYASAEGADLRPTLTEAGDEYGRLHPRRAMPAPAASRNYMAGVGLFLSRVGFEQQQEGEHPYGYANNNPLINSDPTGLTPRTSKPSPGFACLKTRLPPASDPAYNCYLDVCNEYQYWQAHLINLRYNLCDGYLRTSTTIQCLPDCRAGDMFIGSCDVPIVGFWQGGSGRMHQLPYPFSTQGFCGQECDVRVCCSIYQPNLVLLDTWLTFALQACKRPNVPLPVFEPSLPDCTPDYWFWQPKLQPEPKRRKIRR